MTTVNPPAQVAMLAGFSMYPYVYDSLGNRVQFIKTLMTVLFPLLLLWFQRSPKLRLDKDYIIWGVAASVLVRVIWAYVNRGVKGLDNENSIEFKRNTLYSNLASYFALVITMFLVYTAKGKQIYNASNFA